MHFATKKVWRVQIEIMINSDGQSKELDQPEIFWFEDGAIVEGVPKDVWTSFSMTFTKIEGSVRFNPRSSDGAILAIHSIHGQVATISHLDYPVHPLTSPVHF